MALELSLTQVAKVVTALARGKTPAQTAGLLHLPEPLVQDLAVEHGWPNLGVLTKAARELNRELKLGHQAAPVVLKAPARRPAASKPVPEPEADPEPTSEHVHEDGSRPHDCPTCRLTTANPEPVVLEGEVVILEQEVVEDVEEAPVIDATGWTIPTPDAPPAAEDDPDEAIVEVRIIERVEDGLLGEAYAIRTPTMLAIADQIVELGEHLAVLISDWHTLQDRRAAWTDELDALEARRSWLLDQLAELEVS